MGKNKYKNVKELGLRFAELEILHENGMLDDESFRNEIRSMINTLSKDISTKYELDIDLPLPAGIRRAVD